MTPVLLQLLTWMHTLMAKAASWSNFLSRSSHCEMSWPASVVVARCIPGLRVALDSTLGLINYGVRRDSVRHDSERHDFRR